MAALTTNKSILSWIDEKIELVKPDKVVWIDGSDEQIEAHCRSAHDFGYFLYHPPQLFRGRTQCR